MLASTLAIISLMIAARSRNRSQTSPAAGGRFVPRLFGWMAHVYMFGGDDPLTIWGGEHADHMHMHDKP